MPRRHGRAHRFPHRSASLSPTCGHITTLLPVARPVTQVVTSTSGLASTSTTTGQPAATGQPAVTSQPAVTGQIAATVVAFPGAPPLRPIVTQRPTPPPTPRTSHLQAVEAALAQSQAENTLLRSQLPQAPHRAQPSSTSVHQPCFQRPAPYAPPPYLARPLAAAPPAAVAHTGTLPQQPAVAPHAASPSGIHAQ